MSLALDPNKFCLQNSCLFLIGFIFFVFLILLVSLLIYPIYVKSFRSNRERDEAANSSIFYILKHFYHVVNFMEICFLVNILCVVLVPFIAGLNLLSDLLIYSVIFISFIIIITVTTMENIMLSTLAIHRFLLYFFPKTEKFLTASLETMSMTVKLLYIIIFIINFITRFIKMLMMATTYKNTGNFTYEGNSEMDKIDSIVQETYFGLIIFLFLSASLYIPMIISIKKLTNLQSVKKSQPEKYILYQTLFLVVFRLLYIPMLYFLFTSLSQFNELLLFVAMLIVDMFVTHFIIQVSYLSCNKKHLETILNLCARKQASVSYMDTDTVHSTIEAVPPTTRTHLH